MVSTIHLVPSIILLSQLYLAGAFQTYRLPNSISLLHPKHHQIISQVSISKSNSNVEPYWGGRRLKCFSSRNSSLDMVKSSAGAVGIGSMSNRRSSHQNSKKNRNSQSGNINADGIIDSQIVVTSSLASSSLPMKSTTGTNSSNQKKNNGNTSEKNNKNNNKKKKKKKTDPDEENLLPFTKQLTGILEEPKFELSSGFLVLLSSFAVAVGTLPASTIPPDILRLNVRVEDAITFLFGFEFFIRWYGVGQMNAKYLTKPSAIIDILVSVLPLILTITLPFMLNSFGSEVYTFVPGWLMSGSALSNLRLLRILRLQRALEDMSTFTKFQITLGLKPRDVRPYQLQLARVLLSVFTLLSVSSGLIYTAEHEVNPNIPDFFSALYFGLTTLTTVGFGDITPVTLQGRLVVCASILAGVAIIPAQGAALVEALLDFQNERMLEQKQEMERKRRKNLVTGFSSTSCSTDDDDDNDEEEVVPKIVTGFGGTCKVAKKKPSTNETQQSARSQNSSVPLFENNEKLPIVTSRPRASSMVEILDGTGLACNNCGAESHRVDASFCWSCGSSLRE